MSSLRSRTASHTAEPGATAGVPRRRRAAVGFTRLAGLLGVVGVATAVAAVLGTQDVDAWIVGLVASGVTLVLTAILLRAVRAEP